MAKGVAIKFKSYEETIPKVLKLIRFDNELKKHHKIILKPNLLSGEKELSTPVGFVEEVLRFCMESKNPGTEIFIAEGCDGKNTNAVFSELGYQELSEKYGIGLIDLNNTETEEMEDYEFLEFESIHYPKILTDGFLISLPVLRKHPELEMAASLDNLIGAFPAKHYRGVFSKKKSKLNNYSLKHQVYDILKCRMPDLAMIDASKKGYIITGKPLDMDKQAAKLLDLDWKKIEHLRLIDESLSGGKNHQKEVEELIRESE